MQHNWSTSRPPEPSRFGSFSNKSGRPHHVRFAPLAIERRTSQVGSFVPAEDTFWSREEAASPPPLQPNDQAGLLARSAAPRASIYRRYVPSGLVRLPPLGAGVYLVDGCQLPRPESVLDRHTFLRWPLGRKPRSFGLNAGRAPLRHWCHCRTGRRTRALNVHCSLREAGG